MSYYIMSDIHGCLENFKEALTLWDKENETLVLMGDYIDRGPNSFEVVQLIMQLKKENPKKVIVLKGNHEDMFLQWLKSDEELLSFYYSDMHNETLQSFLKERYKKETRKQNALSMLHMFKDELHFLDNLDCYYETNKIIFVHAGINMESSNWRLEKNDLLWIRNDFYHSKKTPKKRVFFGHTPTRLLHKSEIEEENSFFNFNSIWKSEDNMKVGIDGGVSINGQLNALKVNEDGEILSINAF